jgi:hypothetical protein
MMRNYNDLTCQDTYEELLPSSQFSILDILRLEAVLFAMARTFAGPCYGMISEIEEFGLRL